MVAQEVLEIILQQTPSENLIFSVLLLVHLHCLIQESFMEKKPQQ